MYVPRHFALHELVPRSVFEGLPERRILELFDDRLLRGADLLRDRYGRLVCNTWRRGGRIEFRGFRPHDCPDGQWTSQHQRGRALDSVPAQTSAAQIRADLIADPSIADNLITCVEADVAWLHIDTRNHDVAALGMLVVRPN